MAVVARRCAASWWDAGHRDHPRSPGVRGPIVMCGVALPGKAAEPASGRIPSKRVGLVLPPGLRRRAMGCLALFAASPLLAQVSAVDGQRQAGHVAGGVRR